MKNQKKENDRLAILHKNSGKELSVEQSLMRLLGKLAVSQEDAPHPHLAQNPKIPKTSSYDLKYPAWTIS